MSEKRNGKRPNSPKCRNKLCSGYMGSNKTMKRIYIRDNGIQIGIGWICTKCGCPRLDNISFIECFTQIKLQNGFYDLFPTKNDFDNDRMIYPNKNNLLLELKIIKKLVQDIPEKENNKAIDKVKCINYIDKFITHIDELDNINLTEK